MTTDYDYVTDRLDTYADACHTNSVSHGFYEDYDMTVFKDFASKVALIHSEGTEVLEAYRKEKGAEEIGSEIADILIRTFDLWAALKEVGFVEGTLTAAVDKKMAKNITRPHMHGVLG